MLCLIVSLCFQQNFELEEKEDEERVHRQHEETLERWRQQRNNSRSRTAASIRKRRNRVAPLPQKNDTQKRIHTAWQHAQEQVMNM